MFQIQSVLNILHGIPESSLEYKNFLNSIKSFSSVSSNWLRYRGCSDELYGGSDGCESPRSHGVGHYEDFGLDLQCLVVLEYQECFQGLPSRKLNDTFSSTWISETVSFSPQVSNTFAIIPFR